jgi:hypothetical protein
MVGNKCPCETFRFGFRYYDPQPFCKKIPVGVIMEDAAARYPPDNDVIERSGRIYTCFSWHGSLYKKSP